MKSLAWLAGAAGAAALMFGASASQAKTDLFSYTSTGDAPVSATGSFTFHGVGNGVYEITGITGSVDGDPISGLITNPNAPNPTTSADGLFIYDNDIFKAPPTLSNPGVFFSGSSGIEYNLFSQGSEYVLYEGVNGSFGPNSVGTFSLTGGIPEPATWLMMLMGVAAIGGGLRLGRERQSLEQAAASLGRSN